MNTSALKQMLRCWPEIIGGLDFLRGLYLRHQPREEVSILDLWRISRLGGDLPGYLLLRERDPVRDGELPAFVASLFKVVIGITTTIRSQFIENLPDETYSVHTPVEPASLYGYAESRELLIGKEQVCAGPQRMIMETLQLLTYGQSDAAANRKQFKSLTPRPKLFFDYSCHLTDCHFFNLLFDAINNCLVHDVSRILRRSRKRGRARPSFLVGLLKELDECKRASERSLFKAFSVLGGEERTRRGKVICSMLTGAGRGRRKNHLSALADAMANIWKSPRDIAADKMLQLLRGRNGERESQNTRLLRPIVKQLVIYLEAEWLWLQSLAVTEARLKKSLGRAPSAVGARGLDVLLSESPLRSFFKRAFGIKYRHDEKATVVRLGRAVVSLEHTKV